MTKIQTQFNKSSQIVLPSEQSFVTRFKEKCFSQIVCAKRLQSIHELDSKNLITVKGIVRKILSQETGINLIYFEDQLGNKLQVIYYHKNAEFCIGAHVEITGKLIRQANNCQIYKIKELN